MIYLLGSLLVFHVALRHARLYPFPAPQCRNRLRPASSAGLETFSTVIRILCWCNKARYQNHYRLYPFFFHYLAISRTVGNEPAAARSSLERKPFPPSLIIKLNSRIKKYRPVKCVQKKEEKIRKK